MTEKEHNDKVISGAIMGSLLGARLGPEGVLIGGFLGALIADSSDKKNK